MAARAAASTHEVLLHPERLRIAAEFVGRAKLTTSALHALLDDVPIATLYRHLALLCDAGVLVVTDTEAKRGATEKTYALQTSPLFPPSSLLTGDDFLRVVTTFIAMLLGDFTRWVRKSSWTARTVDPMLRGYAVYATDDEFRELSATLNRIAEDAGKTGARERTPERRRRFFYIAALPDSEGAP
jgi:hypothetical protein